MAERGKFWTAAETKLLIDTWSQDSIQKQLHGTKRNDNVFAQIVNTLAKRGYHRTVQQCRAKIKYLKKRYKEIADRLRKSGEGRESDADDVPANFPFFWEHRCSIGWESISVSSAFAGFSIWRHPATDRASGR